MTLGQGSQLGPYRILAPIGAGGMGEVYKAKDTRLDRTVAIKVLPEHLSKDPALRERFEREARAVSSLNHPHICTLFDVHLRQPVRRSLDEGGGYGGQVGSDDDIDYIVMEHIDGETLADRLKKGALPLELALEYAVQITDALHNAHREGVVHRDLKPGNIILAKPGVKLLDFGLAKTQAEKVAPTEDSEQPTQHKPLTDAGTVLGTVQYMAPEQLEGKDVDARADLFAFGAVLFEMVTGRRAFRGESQASLISAIMSSDPPAMSELEATSPPALDRVLKKCLAKDPDERWQSAHDVGTQLQWIAGSDAAVATSSSKRGRWLPWVFAGLAASTAVVLGWGSNPEPPTLEVVRFETGLDVFNTAWAPGMALSPDGKYLVYGSAPPGLHLRVRSLDSLTSHELDGAESGRNPFFSPDGRWVAFATNSQIKKVSVEGGRSQVIGAFPLGFAAHPAGTWNASGIVLVTTGSGLYLYPADGGLRETVLELDATTGILLHPHWLPDERHALVTLKRGTQNSVHLVDVDTGEMRELIESGAQASYLPSGHLIFLVRAGAGRELHAAAFDIGRLVVQGTSTPMPDSIFAIETGGGGYFTVSASGHLAYLPSGTTYATSLVWADREGATTVLDIEPGVFRHPSFSPDGRRLAVDSHVGGEMEHDIWIYDLQTGSRTRFTFPGHNASPVWTPDGARLAFASRRPPQANIQSIYWKRTDSAMPADLLVGMEFPAYPVSWSPGGENLAFVMTHPDTRDDVWVLSLGAEPEALLASEFDEHSPMFSPDGRWLAYVSDESGREEVYVRPFPGEGGKQAVSTSGGREPMWSRDGRTLFFRNVRGTEMWSADVELEPTFRAAKPEHLFTRTFLTDPNRQQAYDVSPDGQRLLMVEEIGGSAQSQAVIVLNWAEELKRLVPAE